MFSKISSWVIPHSKRVSKIFIFYIKNDNFWQNRIKIHTKLHHLKKILGGACPQTPLAKRTTYHFATCKFPILEKKFLAPPPSQILATPLKYSYIYLNIMFIFNRILWHKNDFVCLVVNLCGIKILSLYILTFARYDHKIFNL